jgi:hypothetical protein
VTGRRAETCCKDCPSILISDVCRHALRRACAEAQVVKRRAIFPRFDRVKCVGFLRLAS